MCSDLKRGDKNNTVWIKDIKMKEIFEDKSADKISNKIEDESSYEEISRKWRHFMI